MAPPGFPTRPPPDSRGTAPSATARDGFDPDPIAATSPDDPNGSSPPPECRPQKSDFEDSCPPPTPHLRKGARVTRPKAIGSTRVKSQALDPTPSPFPDRRRAAPSADRISRSSIRGAVSTPSRRSGVTGSGKARGRRADRNVVNYNHTRPHGSLGHLTPSEYANRGQKTDPEASNL
jgi:hypothetical protein